MKEIEGFKCVVGGVEKGVGIKDAVLLPLKRKGGNHELMASKAIKY